MNSNNDWAGLEEMKGNMFKMENRRRHLWHGGWVRYKNSTRFYDRWNIYVFISRYKYSIISIDRWEPSGATTISPTWKGKNSHFPVSFSMSSQFYLHFVSNPRNRFFFHIEFMCLPNVIFIKIMIPSTIPCKKKTNVI